MLNNENKNERFKRLAKQRGDRILKDLQLIGNLSNTNNYEYSDDEVNKIFNTINNEFKTQKNRFKSSRKTEIQF